MNTHEAIVKRIYELCDERNWSPNHLSYESGVSQSTIKSILLDESHNTGIVTIKRLCEGFNITLAEFFVSPDFEVLDDEEELL